MCARHVPNDDAPVRWKPSFVVADPLYCQSCGHEHDDKVTTRMSFAPKGHKMVVSAAWVCGACDQWIEREIPFSKKEYMRLCRGQLPKSSHRITHRLLTPVSEDQNRYENMTLVRKWVKK